MSIVFKFKFATRPFSSRAHDPEVGKPYPNGTLPTPAGLPSLPPSHTCPHCTHYAGYITPSERMYSLLVSSSHLQMIFFSFCKKLTINRAQTLTFNNDLHEEKNAKLNSGKHDDDDHIIGRRPSTARGIMQLDSRRAAGRLDLASEPIS